ncbi:hypothetical protein LIA77_10531 [Sarocladium implicatum]|nr:hypothetical protein LIA77_10531 [Sarocladium implicatum]
MFALYTNSIGPTLDVWSSVFSCPQRNIRPLFHFPLKHTVDQPKAQLRKARQPDFHRTTLIHRDFISCHLLDPAVYRVVPKGGRGRYLSLNLP